MYYCDMSIVRKCIYYYAVLSKPNAVAVSDYTSGLPRGRFSNGE